jgi:hypothetical protein
MCKEQGFKLCLLFFILTFYSLSILSAYAQENCDDHIVISTDPGNRDYPTGWSCGCDPYIPVEFDEGNTPETITFGQYINVYVTDGCPPYTYTVSGTGYTWHENGLAELVSNNLNERLDCAGGT